MVNMKPSGEISDLLVLGATGFTGRLISRYLSTHPQRHLFSLSLAARSPSRLQAVVDKLNIADSVRQLQVDVTDAESVERAVKSTRVVINTVGPFWRWGTVVVAACVRNGVHYVDLTGETAWIKKIINLFDYAATKTHAVIVPSSGYDSIPSDITAHLANKTLRAYAEANQPGAQLVGLGTSTTAHNIQGGVSGGTWASVMTVIEDVPPEANRVAGMPYSLSPILGTPPPLPRLIYILPIPNAKSIIGGFFVMRPTNTALVQRTFGLLEMQALKADLPAEAKADAERSRYGPAFVYDEFMTMPSRLSAFVTSTALLLGFALLTLVKPFRLLVKKFITQSGDGPSEQEMSEGYLECTNITTSAPSPLLPPVKVKTILKAKGDPGYALTAIMISESALCLLLPPPSLGEGSEQQYNPIHALPRLAQEGGVLTPMTAFGDVLIQRLRETGTFKIDSYVVDDDAGREERKHA